MSHMRDMGHPEFPDLEGEQDEREDRSRDEGDDDKDLTAREHPGHIEAGQRGTD